MREEGSRPLTGFIIRCCSRLRSSQYQAFFSYNIKFYTLQKQSDRNTCWGGKTIHKDTRIDSLFFLSGDIFFPNPPTVVWMCSYSSHGQTHTRKQAHNHTVALHATPQDRSAQNTHEREMSPLFMSCRRSV